MKQISVIGSSTATPESEEYKFAYTLGKLLGEKKIAVICGGRTGIMEAVCKGVKESGGLTIGIMPSYDGSEANEFVDIKINTGMSWNRNPIVVASGELVVAVGGNYGTLSEIAYSFILGKKILGYKTHNINGIEVINSPEDVLRYI
ncbi:TIGR00725 family protein [Persephonella sp.]